MIVNMIVSVSVLVRYSEREKSIEPSNSYDVWLYSAFPDDKMNNTYPNASHVN